MQLTGNYWPNEQTAVRNETIPKPSLKLSLSGSVRLLSQPGFVAEEMTTHKGNQLWLVETLGGWFNAHSSQKQRPDKTDQHKHSRNNVIIANPFGEKQKWLSVG